MTKPGLTAPQISSKARLKTLPQIERTLGAALRDFASELRLADAADFAAFIRIGHMANLQSLVQSSAELYFKPGTLELAEPGELDLDWAQPPLDNAAHEVPPRRGAGVFPAPAGGGLAAVEVELIAAESGATGADLHGKLREALASARILRGVKPRADKSGPRRHFLVARILRRRISAGRPAATRGKEKWRRAS